MLPLTVLNIAEDRSLSMSFTTGNMQTRSFRTRSCFRCLWVLLTVFLCEAGTELSNTHSSGQLSGQLTPYMLLFFLAALISMVLATQSIYFAYLGEHKD